MSAELSIVIVNWNGIKFLPNCLRSIIENPPSVPYEIVVVDNDSGDGSLDWLKGHESEMLLRNTPFTLIESEDNLGFGRANNLAFDRTSSPYVFVLNPDTLVEDGSIDRLISTLQSDEGIGMAVPRIVGPDELVQANIWTEPTPLKIIVQGLRLDSLLPEKIRSEWLLTDHLIRETELDAELAVGCAMMIKRSTLEKVGGFDPRFHMYGEDVELCSRIRRHGRRIRFQPESVIVHLGGQSAIQRWDTVETRMRESLAVIQYQMIAFSRLRFFANCLSTLFVLTISIFVNTLRRRDTNDFRRRWILYYRNLFYEDPRL